MRKIVFIGLFLVTLNSGHSITASKKTLECVNAFSLVIEFGKKTETILMNA